MTKNLNFDGWFGERAGEEGWNFNNEDQDFSLENSFQGAHSVVEVEDYIYVADFFAKDVKVFSSEGIFLHEISSFGNNQLILQGPAGINLDNDGFIWISDWYLNAIIKIDQEGNFIGWLGRFSESEDSYFHQDKIPIQSSAYGGFFKPHMIAFDESNNIYVIETGNNRLQKFDSNFNFIGWIGFDSTSNASLDGWSRQGIAASSNKIGGFSNPTSIRIFNNKIYVADNGNNRIQRFKLDGTFDGWIGGTESESLLKDGDMMKLKQFMVLKMVF